MKKRWMALGLVSVLAATMLAGCGDTASSSSEAQSSTAQGTSTVVADGNYKVGVVQYVAHDALDATYKGFVDALAEEGFVEGKNLTIDFQNAQGEIANCSTIAAKLVNAKSDLILAIATPAAQAAAQATKDKQDIPVLITAVTDPADAGLVATNEAPGGNISGTSDLTPVKEQIELLQTMVPDAKKIGLLYSSSEANSVFQVEIAKKAAEELGIETQDFTVSSTNDLQQVVQSMVGKVDAIYAPTDNMIASGMPAVAAIATENKIPLVVGERGMVENGALASYSIDYYELGKMTGMQAAKILKGEAKPATMPIEYQENFTLDFNPKTGEAIGIEAPEGAVSVG